MIQPIPSVTALPGITPVGADTPTPAETAAAMRPGRERDSASFSPEALALLEAQQADDGD